MIDLFQRHSKAIDVIAQVNSGIAIAVWGPVRLLLQCVSDKEQASLIAIEAISVLVQSFDRWEDVGSIYLENDRIRPAIVKLYEFVLDLLTSSLKYLTASTLRRLLWSIWAAEKEKLQEKLKRVRRADKELHKVVQTKHMKEDVEHRTNQADQVAGLNNAMRGLTEAFLQPSLPASRLRSDGVSAQGYCEFSMDVIEAPLRRSKDLSTKKEALEWLAGGSRVLSTNDRYHPTEGTGRWLFSRPEFRHWAEHDKPKLFWLQGKPGAGKSFLSVTLTDYLRSEQKKPVIFCSFSSGLSNPQASNPSSFAAALLSYMFHNPHGEQQPESILEEIFVLKMTFPLGPYTCPFKKLWRLCHKVIETHPKPECFLILDALDECSFLNNEYDLKPRVFLSELEKLSQKTPIRTAIFSRPQSEFSDFIDVEFQIQVDQGLNGPDIQLYLVDEFLERKTPSEYRRMISEQIEAQADGMFLWAKLFLEYLHKPCEHDEFLTRLRNFPPGLNQVYEQLTRESTLMLDPEQRSRRHKLLLLMCEAQELLTVDEISRALSWGRFDSGKIISEIGRPLVEVHGSRVTFIHKSFQEWLTDESRLPNTRLDETEFVQPEESHARLAEECLQCLVEPEYGSTGSIGKYMHHNFETTCVDPVPEPSKGVSFAYAYKYWDFHLTAVSDPHSRLLKLAEMFLHLFQFVFWSEYSLYRLSNDFSKIRLAYVHLRIWFSRLSDDQKKEIRIDDYFADPYARISDVYKETETEDRTLQWLAQMQLSRWYVDVGTAEKAVPILEAVTNGLDHLLGHRHPLTLRARMDKATLLLQQKRIREANLDFAELAVIEKEVLGPDATPLFKAIYSRGFTEFLMNRYGEALASQKEASRGFLRLLGPDDSQYLASQFCTAWVLVELGKLARALDILSNIFERRREKYGHHDTFAGTVQYSIGDIQRKQSRQEESLKNLLQAFELTIAVIPLCKIWSMDIAISLLIAYRDFEIRDDALAMLERLDKEANVKQFFDRFCQVNHIRGLLYYDDGDVNRAISLLQGIVIDADREEYNRALLWIIVDLAILLRRRGKEGDEKQAESNFDHILRDLRFDETSLHENGDPEPDPPRLLKLAETALTLTRRREFDEVRDLFEQEKVDWYHEEDLWISFGAPAADTTSMKAPA